MGLSFFALGIAVSFGVAVLIKHLGLFVGVLFTAEVGGEGDREGGEGRDFLHVGKVTGQWQWQWSVGQGGLQVGMDAVEMTALYGFLIGEGK